MPRGGNAFHTAKQRHQIRNFNVFERMHGIFALAAGPLVGVAGPAGLLHKQDRRAGKLGSLGTPSGLEPSSCKSALDASICSAANSAACFWEAEAD
jgi:hypothetical protein